MHALGNLLEDIKPDAPFSVYEDIRSKLVAMGIPLLDQLLLFLRGQGLFRMIFYLWHGEMELIGGLDVGGLPEHGHQLRQIVESGKARPGAVFPLRGGLDQRLINPLFPDNPGSKVNMCVENVFRIWENGQDSPGHAEQSAGPGRSCQRPF